MTDFDYLNLADINPEIAPVPEGSYNFRVVKAEKSSYTAKKDDPKTGVVAGDEMPLIQLRLAVMDDPEYTGRIMFESLFPNSETFRCLRLIQDASGVIQTGNITDWLTDLVNSQATFNAFVKAGVDKRSGKPNSRVRFGTVKPVA